VQGAQVPCAACERHLWLSTMSRRCRDASISSSARSTQAILRIFESAKDFSRENRYAGEDLKRDSCVLVRMTTTGGLGSALSFTVKR